MFVRRQRRQAYPLIDFSLFRDRSLLTGVIVVGLLPVLEGLFKRTTDITFLELTDYNHPLLRLMQLEAQKMDLLFDVFTIGLCLLVVLFGRRFKAGWRSHTQQILIGLSTASISQMVVRGVWQLIATRAVPHSQEEYQHVIGLQEKLYNANSALFVAVVVWWIVCLWINEPGTETPAAIAAEPSANETAEPVAAAGEKIESAAS